jgi:K319-like protein
LSLDLNAGLTALQGQAYGFSFVMKAILISFGLAIVVCRSAAAQPTQPIYLQYDGFVRNPNGTLTLSFGYYNMNNVDVTVQPGDANSFAPAPADRNQPITFLKGRHRFACSMVVDKTFDGRLQWTVKFAGKTETTTAKALDPLYELELNSEKRAIAGLDVAAAPKNVCVNRPPVAEIVNPFGGPDASAKLAAKVDQDLAINGRVEDDGLPRGSKVTVAWKKVSGPGNVTFSDAASGPTRAKFSAPGAYEIELTATDGEKTSTLKVSVTVT